MAGATALLGKEGGGVDARGYELLGAILTRPLTGGLCCIRDILGLSCGGSEVEWVRG